MKRFATILLCLLLILPVFAAFSVSSAADEPALTAEFTNDLRGSASGEYTFRAGKAGTYSLFWADADGAPLTVTLNGKTLKYTALTEIKATAGENVFRPQPFTVIPYGAKKMIAVDSTGATVASFDLPAAKLLEKEQDLIYGVLSDLHYNTFSNTASDDAIASVDRAYELLEEVGVTTVFETGDFSANSDEPAYKKYAEAIAKTNLTVIACGGNHEVAGGFENMYGEKGIWYKYVNKGVFDGTLEGVTDKAPNKYDFVYRMPGTDEVFISISQVRWDNRTSQEKSLVTLETVEWLGTMLEKYKDLNCHLLMHTYLSDDDHLHADGEGDLTNGVGYGYNGFYNVSTEEEQIFRDLFAKYKDLIWYNGHSHWCFEMQSFNNNLNVYDYDGTTATYVHVPSVTAPRSVSNTETQYHTNAGKRSEGYLTFCGDGYKIINGIDFVTGEIDAFACYIIYPNETKTVTGKDKDVVWTYDKQFGSLRLEGSGETASLSGADAQPFREFAGKITSVYVARGISDVGSFAFADLPKLTTVEVKDTVRTIGQNAFAGCAAIQKLTLPESLSAVKENAFNALGKGCAIVFTGTPEQYAAVEIAAGNEPLDSAGKTYEKRIVTWKIGDFVKTETYKIGEIPAYVDVVANPGDATSYFPFTGWNNGKTDYKAGADLPKVNANVTYTAQFGEKSDRLITDGFEDRKGKFTWTLDRCYGVLTVTGRGEMPDLASYTDQPWAKYKNEIYTVVVEKADKIGKNSFAHLPNLQTIIFEDKVYVFGNDCFAYNDQLTEAYLPKGLKSVSQGASYNCNNLTNIHFGGTEEQWKKISANFSVYNDILKDAKNVQFESTAPLSVKYTVTFQTPDGKTIAEIKDVAWGEGVTPPAAPEISGSAFVGWDAPYFLIKEDTVIHAIYEEAEPVDPPSEPVVPTPSETAPSAPSSPSRPAPSDAPGGKLPLPALIGIIAGAVLVVAAVVVVVIVVSKKKK